MVGLIVGRWVVVLVIAAGSVFLFEQKKGDHVYQDKEYRKMKEMHIFQNAASTAFYCSCSRAYRNAVFLS